ncbi:hypothetical protein [Devosia sp. 1566]|uniref:hypothetical protein n=1 Tax=Devosia sp. 1566 TaxID=2499144 RepID=UPI000FDC751D|nr:hypothetical protein [Devosia sp. 1566]
MSRHEIESLVIAEGTYAARKAVRVRRVVQEFLNHTLASYPDGVTRLIAACEVFVRLFGERMMSTIREPDIQRAAEAIKHGRVKPAGCKRPLSPATVYHRMLALAELAAYAVAQHFTDVYPMGAQVVRPRASKPASAVNDPEVFESLRDAADINQTIVFDLSAGQGASEAQILDVRWRDFDPVRGRIYLQPSTEETEEDCFGRWAHLRERELLGLLRGRLDRIKRDRLGDERIFALWRTDHGIIGALCSLQFKHLVKTRGRAESKVTPTTYVGRFAYRDFRLAAGRRVAASNHRLHEVAKAVGYSDIRTVKRLFGPYMPPSPGKPALPGEATAIRRRIGKFSHDV